MTRGGGDSINVSPRNHNFTLQLVNIGLKSRDIVLANVNVCPPSSSKSVFFDEFSLFLTNLGMDAVDRLMICGDFNLPGTSPDTIDNGSGEMETELTSILDKVAPVRTGHRIGPR